MGPKEPWCPGAGLQPWQVAVSFLHVDVQGDGRIQGEGRDLADSELKWRFRKASHGTQEMDRGLDLHAEGRGLPIHWVISLLQILPL